MFDFPEPYALIYLLCD